MRVLDLGVLERLTQREQPHPPCVDLSHDGDRIAHAPTRRHPKDAVRARAVPERDADPYVAAGSCPVTVEVAADVAWSGRYFRH